MATTQEEQISFLNARLSELENESRRVLGALHWSSRVRVILLLCLLMFIVVFGVLYYRLYSDIKNNRIEEIRLLINERPEELSEPLTRQMFVLLQEQGPYLANVFRDQMSADQKKYVAALSDQRELLSDHMVRNFEEKLNTAYSSILSTHEAILQREFPDLKDEEKLQLVRSNLEDVYRRVGRRYHVDVMRERLTDVIAQIDKFPRTEPRQANVPATEQLATELLELVRMMLINSENFVSPEEMELQTATASPVSIDPQPDVGDSEIDDDQEIPDTDPDSDDGIRPGLG